MELKETLEIRKLSPKYRMKLVSILQNQDDWKILMSNIPELLRKDCFDCTIGENNLPRYNADHIRIIEQASKDSNRAPPDVLFEEWGSSGRVRPTLGHLFHLVQTLEMSQATEYIASLLHKNVTRRPTVGPSAPVVLNTEELKIIEGDTISSEISNLQYPSFSIDNSQHSTKNNIPDLSNLMKVSYNQPQNDSNTTTSSTNDDNTGTNQFLPDFDRINKESESDLIPNSEYNVLKSLCLEGTISDPFPDARKNRSDSAPGKSLSLNTPLRHFNYHDLKEATNNFDTTPYTDVENGKVGRFLGSGGYGSVYLALGLKEEPTAAVKKIALDGQMLKLQDHILNSFKMEVENLYKFKHENLVGLLGYSCDGPSICLVYEYIPGGNLRNHLADNSSELEWKLRVKIALGISKAVCYLHTANPQQPFIHRDIKTANILLDAYKNPKLCDFGTARLSKHTTSHTVNVIGTGPYMSPEGTRGDVSVKLDTFSFGVVLLELLTGWPPLDHSRSSYDLLTYVREVLKDNDENIINILDKNAGDWMYKENNFGVELYKICKQCVEDLKTDRPFMMNVKDRLEILVDLLNNKATLPHISLESLRVSTDNFNTNYLISADTKEFNSTEYLATGLFNVKTIIKKISIDGHSPIYYDFHLNSFKEEVGNISRLKHENVIDLLGYSCEYPYYCLIYEYIQGDMLQNILQSEHRSLNCNTRLEIAVQISRAVAYLHTATPSRIHRDLRSNNILLDENNKVKIRTGKLFQSNSTNSASITKVDPYMPPEGIRGDISPKLDSYSFGIILLELLTGLPAFDDERSSFDLLTFINERKTSNSLSTLLDKNVEFWMSNDVRIDEELFKISQMCVKEKPLRSFMVDLNKQLEELLNNSQPNDDFRPALSFLMD